ncbi:MAG: hypothetical protein AB8B48_17520, partial [Pseudomonadales bacterium]
GLVSNFPQWHSDIKPELLIFVFMFMMYSLIQILLFGPEHWATAMHIERIFVIRLYYYWDATSLIAGGYLLLSMFGMRFHKRWPAMTFLLLFLVTIGYFTVFTNQLIDGVRPGPRDIITLSAPAKYAFLGQAMLYLFTLAIVIGLFRAYRSAKSNEAQIKNVYALAAALVYATSCLLGLHLAWPFLMATRGILFYVVVMLIVQRNSFFDIRPVAAVTAEANTLREFSKIFREYAGEDVGHRESLRRLERCMVAYKLEKVTGFKDGTGSSLPQVAQSMDVKLSSLYDILKRLELDKPPKQNA